MAALLLNKQTCFRGEIFGFQHADAKRCARDIIYSDQLL